MSAEFEVIIGLEVHAQLSTESKVFAPSSTASGKAPNSLTDPVTLGLPGALPVLNKRAVDFAIRLGLATNCSIARESIFARKHYLYPDLPKGYQISQYDKPTCVNGHVDVRTPTGKKRIGITRIHLEEDAGKNFHLDSAPVSLVDLNRAGVPLLEIVSEPDIRSPEEAGNYLRLLHQIVRYLDICDGNMEEGSFRCDANVSIRPRGQEQFGTKVEIKNINSFRHVEKAIAHEIERQTQVVNSGERVLQQTRLFDEASGTTKAMRSKEEAQDYRYFPDPDLLPLIIDDEWINRVSSYLPELPHQAFERFEKMYGLDPYFCEILTEERRVLQYYDQALSHHHSPAGIANWVTTELFGRLNKEGMTIEQCPISPHNLADLVRLIDDGTISGKIAKTIFDEMFAKGTSPDDIVEQQGLRQVSDSSVIEKAIDDVIEKNPTQLADYRAGKTRMLGFFVGQVMKMTEGKANPQMVNDLLLKKLGPVS